MKTQTAIPRVSAKLKRSSTPYDCNGETVFIFSDKENGDVWVDYTTEYKDIFKVKKEDIKPARKTVKPINQFSETRAKENKIYLTLRKVFLENHSKCEANLPGCKKVADQVHHAGGRIGKRLIDVSLFMAFCGNCHTWVNEHPEEAIEMGLAVQRL